MRAETPVSVRPFRGRPRPSETETPRLTQRSSNGASPGPPTVGLAQPCEEIRAAGTQETAFRKLVSRTLRVSHLPLRRHAQTAAKRAPVLAPAVTRPRPGHAEAREGRTSQCALPGHRAHGAGTPAPAPVRGQQPVRGPRARGPGGERRPTTCSILPVAYACQQSSRRAACAVNLRFGGKLWCQQPR